MWNASWAIKKNPNYMSKNSEITCQETLVRKNPPGIVQWFYKESLVESVNDRPTYYVGNILWIPTRTILIITSNWDLHYIKSFFALALRTPWEWTQVGKPWFRAFLYQRTQLIDPVIHHYVPPEMYLEILLTFYIRIIPAVLRKNIEAIFQVKFPWILQYFIWGFTPANTRAIIWTIFTQLFSGILFNIFKEYLPPESPAWLSMKSFIFSNIYLIYQFI